MSDTPTTPRNESVNPTRGPGGRFAKGNPGGPGNPNLAALNRAGAELRREWDRRIKGTDIALAIKTLRRVMREGKDADAISAAREMLNRTIGVPTAVDVLERLENLERAIANRQNGACNGN